MHEFCLCVKREICLWNFLSKKLKRSFDEGDEALMPPSIVILISPNFPRSKLPQKNSNRQKYTALTSLPSSKCNLIKILNYETLFPFFASLRSKDPCACVIFKFHSLIHIESLLGPSFHGKRFFPQRCMCTWTYKKY